MRVLVTGGAGFIASHVVDALVGADHEVSIVDNLSTGRRENLNPAAEFHEMSINAPAFRTLTLDLRPDVIVHHAAQMDVRRSVRDPIFDAEENILGSLRLMMAAVEAGVKKIVYASTGGATYGDVEANPVNETLLPNPISQYGISKHTVEHYLFLYRRLYGLDYTILRYPNVYGPRQNPHGEAGVVAIFAEKMLTGEQCTIFGDGTKARDYVYVSDVVRANLLALSTGGGGLFNLGTGRETSDQEVYDAVARACGYAGEPVYGEARPGEVYRIALDASRAGRELGWTAEVGFDEGIASTVQAMRSNNR